MDQAKASGAAGVRLHCPGDLMCPPESSRASRLSIALSAGRRRQGGSGTQPGSAWR